MLSKKTLHIAMSLLVLASLLLSACQPQTIIQTRTVIETVVVTEVVEKEGETIFETRIVEVTPVPTTEAAEPIKEVSPEFKNPDTYMSVGGAGEQETLDPHWSYETAGLAIEVNIYESMVTFNRTRTDDFVPVLATEWEPNEAGNVWTFNVREGVKFHQGGTLEPHDVAYSMYRAMLQGRTGGAQWMTYQTFFGPNFAVSSVKDFATAMAGKETFDDLSDADLQQVCEKVKETVVADDEAGTVTFNLHAETPWFLSLMVQPFFGTVLDQEWMAENGDWDGDCAAWKDFADPAVQDSILFNRSNGTGPYKLDHWTPGEETVLVAFEDYWRTEPIWEGGPSGPASIKEVIFKNIPEWGTRLAMFEAGDADTIYVPLPFRPQLFPYYQKECDGEGNCKEANPQGYIQAYTHLPAPNITPAQFNWQINVEGGNSFIGSGALDGNGIPPDFFSDIHVRKAFNYCFDFDGLIEDALHGEGLPAQGPIPQGMMGYREGEDPLYSYDPARCEEEFKLADVDKDGIPAGEDEDDVWNKGFYIQIAFNTGVEDRRLSAEILKAGIESVNPLFSVALVSMPWPVFLDSLFSGRLPLFVSGWVEDYHDPHNWVQPFLHSQGAYGSIIKMTPELAAEIDALILEGITLTAVEDRTPIYEELQRIAQEQAVNVWLYQELQRSHFQEWIHGYYYNPGFYTLIYVLSKEAP